MHPFQAARLGTAPFRFVGMRENRFEMPGFGWKPGGACDYCGTGILYEYVIRSSDGSEFVVGSDCVEKTYREASVSLDPEFLALKRAHQQALRAARKERQEATRKEAREAAYAQRVAARQEAAAAWRAEHAGLVAALSTYEGPNRFLANMRDSLAEWGSLTAGQEAAVARTMAAQAQADAVRERGRHIGQPGDRMRGVPVRVVTCRMMGTATFGYNRNVPRYLIKLETQEGAQLVWWTSRAEQPFDEYCPATFTVKAHDEYQGTAQTTVSRLVFED